MRGREAQQIEQDPKIYTHAQNTIKKTQNTAKDNLGGSWLVGVLTME
jgi:hypothetical protein